MKAAGTDQLESSAWQARIAGLAAWQRVEHFFDAAFGAPQNPLRYLGALGFMLFWLLALSGIYLYAVLDTSADGAYHSIDRLSRQQWYLGGLLRSLHRYAADAFVLVTLAHLLREWLHGHYRGFRRFSWLTGAPLPAFIFISAIGGFWLNWDELGQFSALATAELLDWLPGFASPLTRNFISSAAVSDRLFSLFVFVHLGLPLLLLFGLWFHIQRISQAQVWPPRALAWGAMFTLLLLALLRPVMSQAPASMNSEPELLLYDWLLLAIHPLTYATSAGAVWALIGAVFLSLLALPLLPRRWAPAPIAVVDAANCNGCRRCFDDCPYEAVTMAPHPHRRIGKLMAQVDPDLCAGCGICVGACPSSTPFRSATDLVTGIDMPQAPIRQLREQLRRGLAGASGPRKIVVFGCARGAQVKALAAPDLLPLSLLCIGALPPSFVEYALRDGAAAVLISGCRAGGCEYRLGQRWTEQRLTGVRQPYLRPSVARECLRTVWAGAGDEAALRAGLDQLRTQLQGFQAGAAPAPSTRHG